MRGELFFFLGILALFFILWVSTGGPSRPISFAGPYLNPITTTGTTAQPYGNPNAWAPVDTTISVGGTGVRTYSSGLGASDKRGRVTISRSLSGVAATDPEEEYVIISVPSYGGTATSLAGWKIVNAENGDGAAIPQGAELPVSGRVNTLAPITLEPGEEAIIVTGRSPIGVSFRENSCTGYLEDRQDFFPPLSASCPTPYQELSRFYDEDDDDDYRRCQTYVQTLPYCAAETRVPADVPNSCESFVEDTLNYNGCVARHKNDDGFKSRTWRVFLGERSEIYDRSRGGILLLDAENKVVDSVSY